MEYPQKQICMRIPKIKLEQNSQNQIGFQTAIHTSQIYHSPRTKTDLQEIRLGRLGASHLEKYKNQKSVNRSIDLKLLRKFRI